MAEPEPEKVAGDNEDEEEVITAPVVETAEEKMDRVRGVKFRVIPELAEILQRVFPYFVRKGAKKKTELLEREAGPMLHALAFNPSEEQIAKLCENARYKEVQGTTRGHFEYENFEQRVMEYLHYEPDAFKRHPKEKVLEALLLMCGGQKEVEAEEFKVPTLSSHPYSYYKHNYDFTEDFNTMHAARATLQLFRSLCFFTSSRVPTRQRSMKIS